MREATTGAACRVAPVCLSAAAWWVLHLPAGPRESASHIYHSPRKGGVSLACAELCAGGVLDLPPHRTMVPGQIPVRGSARPVLRLGGSDQASAHWTMAICVHSGYFDNWQPSNLFLAAATYPVDGSCGLKVVSRTHTAHKSGGMRLVIAWAVGTHACTISDGGLPARLCSLLLC